MPSSKVFLKPIIPGSSCRFDSQDKSVIVGSMQISDNAHNSEIYTTNIAVGMFMQNLHVEADNLAVRGKGCSKGFSTLTGGISV